MSLSTFFGLNIGVSALDTMQQAEDVVANNISNANTPGYVQETPQLQEASAYPPIPSQNQPVMGGQLGQGVAVGVVTRETSAFVNQQDRSNQSTYNMYQTYHTNLSQIESILNEPSSNSMQNAVDQFFASWQTLSTDPTNTAARQSVISEAQTLGQTFQTITTQLESLQSNLASQIQGQVQELNNYASQVAQLNNQIVQVNQMNPSQANGGQSSQQESPNQLLDQRGYILDQMAKLASVSYSAIPGVTGAIQLQIGNTLMISSASWTSAGTIATGNLLPPSTGLVLATGSSYSSIGATLSSISSGAIAGNAKSLDYTDQLLGKFNSFLLGFANQVNSVQGSGYPLSGSSTTSSLNGTVAGVTYSYGNLFIVPPNTNVSAPVTGDVTLQINPLFTQGGGSNYIAAASTGTTSGSNGDNGNALNMVTWQSNVPNVSPVTYSAYQVSTTSYQDTTFKGSSTFDQYISGIVSNLGITTSAVNSNEQTANALAQQSTNLRQSISGVDTNNQAAKMVEYQNSYDAAAKFISIYDQMLQSLISMVP